MQYNAIPRKVAVGIIDCFAIFPRATLALRCFAGGKLAIDGDWMTGMGSCL